MWVNKKRRKKIKIQLAILGKLKKMHFAKQNKIPSNQLFFTFNNEIIGQYLKLTASSKQEHRNHFSNDKITFSQKLITIPLALND